jgi:chromatin remodeling complex protein RSC6
MARTKKEVSAQQSGEVAPVVQSAPVAQPPAEQKQRRGGRRAAGATEQVQPAPVAEPVENAVVAPEADAPQGDAPQGSETVELSADFSQLLSRVQQVSSLLSSLRTELRQLERRATRELRTAQRQNARRRRKTGNRAPSGFVKPTLISNELATFLGREKGTEMARTEVTKEINAYIRKNNLQDKSNGRQINADAKLSSLLNLKKGEVLTYFNLQKYMSPHFAKATASA